MPACRPIPPGHRASTAALLSGRVAPARGSLPLSVRASRGAAPVPLPLIQAVTAETYAARLVGLVRCRELPMDRALLFPRCRRVHCAGMHIPIDVVLLDGSLAVLAVRTVEPWHAVPAAAGTRNVLELAVGAAACLQPGDALSLGPAGRI